jgi:NAD/NADP transhydrogenase beta subunit
MKKETPQNATMKQVARLTKLMDKQFSIPGTNIRFGLDGLIGLIPGVGDVSTFAVSCYLLTLMAKNGASGYVMARMVVNVLIDAIIGAIPFVGDLFDFAFKANSRNLRLMQEHFVEGRHRGGAWKVVVPIVIILLLILVGGLWLAWTAVSSLF